MGPAWSVIDSSNNHKHGNENKNHNGRSPRRTSAPLPEAVWYQETSCNADKAAGFFVSLVQKWDLQDRYRVYYQVFPFPVNNKDEKLLKEEREISLRNDSCCSNDIENGNENGREPILEPGPMFSLKLPRRLAIIEEQEVVEEKESLHKEPSTTPEKQVSSPRMQERRVPLLARFSDNQKLLVLQFSPTHVRILKPDQIENKGNMFGHERIMAENKQEFCKHWTVELKSTAKDPYVPIPSAPHVLPQLRTTTTTTSESILPGGIFILDQTYGSAVDFHEFLLVLVTSKSVLCYKTILSLLESQLGTLSMTLTHVFSHPQASAVWWKPKAKVMVVGSYQEQQQQRDKAQTSDRQCLFLRTYFFGHSGPFGTNCSNQILQNPLFLPLRSWDRPPPIRIPAFLVGRNTNTNCVAGNEHKTMDTTETTFSLATASELYSSYKNHRFPITGLAVVELYQETYIVEIGATSTRVESCKHALEVALHKLDLETCNIQCHAIHVSLLVCASEPVI